MREGQVGGGGVGQGRQTPNESRRLVGVVVVGRDSRTAVRSRKPPTSRLRLVGGFRWALPLRLAFEAREGQVSGGGGVGQGRQTPNES
jgi:hypothetical protein